MSSYSEAEFRQRDRDAWAHDWRAALRGDADARERVAPVERCDRCGEGLLYLPAPTTRAEVRQAWRSWAGTSEADYRRRHEERRAALASRTARGDLAELTALFDEISSAFVVSLEAWRAAREEVNA